MNETTMHIEEEKALLQGLIYAAMNMPLEHRKKIRRELDSKKQNEMSLALFLDSLRIMEQDNEQWVNIAG